jgi:hypothetical protein
MITGYEAPKTLSPYKVKSVQWGYALASGIIAGLVLLIVPRGSPWSNLTFFTPTVMGRSALATQTSVAGFWLVHVLISAFYGLLISLTVARLAQFRAILVGGLIGFVLYLLNFAVVNWFMPEYRGNEISVLFTHIVFGLVAAGAYRGLLRRSFA